MTEDMRLAQSRAAIVEAGIAVLLENPSAGMSEIALAAGVGRATLYRHYKSREVLIKELAQLCLEETDNMVEPIKQAGLRGRAAIEATIDVLIPLADRFRFLMSLLSITYDDPTLKRIYRRQLRELAELVDQAKEQREISRDQPTSWVVASFDALLNAGWNLVQSGELSHEQVSIHFKRTFFVGLR